MEVNIYTWARASTKKKIGAWMAILATKTAAGKEATLTINGELEEATQNMADIIALTKAVKRMTKPSKIHIYTDSVYVAGVLEQDLPKRWEEQGWKTSTGGDVKNADKWQELAAGLRIHDIEIHVKEDHSFREWMEREGEKHLKERSEDGKESV